MRRSVLEAINEGHWDYEPKKVRETDFDPTAAMPGSKEKLKTLADRLHDGLPLWHSEDRISFDDSETPAR